MITAIAFLFTLFLSFWAAFEDFRRLQIPNFISVAIAGVFLLAWVFDRHLVGGSWWLPFAISFGIFFLSYLMFAAGIMGAGDSKFATALSLWLGMKGLLIFIFYMSLVGGVLGLITLFIKKHKIFPKASENSWIFQAQSGRNAVPYGIAIMLGFLGAALQGGLIQRYVFL